MAKRLKVFFLIYVILLAIANVSLVAWTYPHGGYGALGAMLVTPIVNLGATLIGLLTVFILKKTGAVVSASNYTASVIIPLVFGIVVYILIFTVYGHGGC